MARFSEAGTQRYLSVPVNFPKLEGDKDSYPELGRSSNSPAFLCYALVVLNNDSLDPKDIYCPQTLMPTF